MPAPSRSSDGGDGPEFLFRAFAEDAPGPEWAARFAELWPDYRRWYLSEGERARPTYLRCERALARWMPAIAPVWARLCELAGGGDLEARFLSHWCPPPYLSGCSQAAFLHGAPLLVRNYDYHPRLFEGIFLRSAWTGGHVLASTDCLIGALDGVNDRGLAASLSFGGKRDRGEGFGAPLVLRWVLETCSDVREAADALGSVPFHMAYNFLLVDRRSDFATVFVSPGWSRHARATATLAREARLESLLEEERTAEGFVDAFLRPPLHNTRYAEGFGTLYTAVYAPTEGTVRWVWPTESWEQSVHRAEAGTRRVRLGAGRAREVADPRDASA